jgi:PTH1 family peptidyl-tRNA hydrolase
LSDIIRACGDDVPRLRIGIGAPPERQDPADYVLGRFTSVERTEMEPAIAEAADAAEVWAREGIAVCMNRFNGSDKDKP